MADDVEHFLEFVLKRSEEISLQENEDILSELLKHIDLLGRTVQLLEEIRDFVVNAGEPDSGKWQQLVNVYCEIESEFICLYNREATRITVTCQQLPLLIEETKCPGRLGYHIPKESLVQLRGLNFSWCKISEMFRVSRWTIMRRVNEYGLSNLQRFSIISDEGIDEIVREYISRHGSTTGEPFMSGYFRSLGHHVQRRRIRAFLNRVDPEHTALRWGALVARRKYFVRWPNSLWHIDGHHSLIRWKFVIHGCCDGKSRKIMYLKCNTNNLAETVLSLFHKAINENHGLWPSRIRVDYGVENVLVCDEMVAQQGEGRGSFIAGSSTRNQRIERLWRDVFRCVCQFFYYTFYAMEQTAILDVENPIHLFALHLVFTSRINTALDDFAAMFNNHRLSTENGWSPNQIWVSGMLNENNPLRFNGGQDDSVVDQHYGKDPDGPQSLSDDGVVVEPVQVIHGREI
ncbi:hypothetical protein AC249_AIPGENE5997 [Paramuricea clavata]|uniref:Integrase core domain-containing protein n=1 Tax=Paramuricea clavata TaxID=317549 RepID=A0A7D9DHI1_PARCT|nr:hypothetical protein AC249_AIPGENE5997 [Paramuricea clavata]